MPVRTSDTDPAWWIVSRRPAADARYGAVSAPTPAAARIATIAVGTSTRRRARVKTKSTIPDAASATAPPLLPVCSQQVTIAVAPASDSARNATPSRRSAESAIAGQVPMRKSAAAPFQYETGKSRRPSVYTSPGTVAPRTWNSVTTARSPSASAASAAASSRSAWVRSVKSGVRKAPA